LFFWKLGSLTFVDEDEAMYAQVAQEMLNRGDWVYPHLNGVYWVDKPPLVPWAIAISFKTLGRNEFSIRLWHSVVALMGVLITYLVGKQLFGEKAGFFSGLILASSLQYFYQARITLCDIPLTFFITLSLYLFLLLVKSRNPFFFYLSIISMAAATLSKGPVGAVLPVSVIILYLIFVREKLFEKKFLFHILMGAGLFLCIVGPWFYLQVLRYGKEFIQRYFFYKHFARFIHPIDVPVSTTKPDPFYSYFFIILAGFLPWSGVMLQGTGSLIKKLLKERKPEEVFTLIWAGVIFLFFSIAGMKVPRYIMPIYPALAIISGRFFLQSEDSQSGTPEKDRRWLSFLLSFILAPFLLLIVIFAKRHFESDVLLYLPVLKPSLIILGAGMGIGSILFFLPDRRIVFVSFLIAGVLSYSSLIFYSNRYFNHLRVSKRFAGVINKLLKPEDRIVDYRPPNPEPSLIFYTNHPVDFIGDEDTLTSLLRSGTRVFCVVPGIQLPALKEKIKIQILDETAGRALVVNRL